MRKTVGIITFHDSINYGALLQAYALQSYIQSLGFEVDIINYKNKERTFAQVKGLKKIRSIIWKKTFYNLFNSKKRLERTNKFINDNLNISKKMYLNSKDIIENPPIYDYYITGSDQVWNPRNNNKDFTYWLAFVPEGKKRISYAPSFGLSNPGDEYLKECVKYIKKFDNISIRENEGKDILRKYYSIDADVVLDPTFLVPINKWNNIIPKKAFREHYILCYFMPGDEKVTNKIKDMSKIISSQTGYEIINIGKKEYDKIKFWEKNKFDCGPIEFLNLIKNADYIITNSFHGTAFSIIFNKTFWVPIHQTLDASKALHSRLTNLLHSLNLEECIQSVDSSFVFDKHYTLNYKNANNLLADLQGKSKKYLKNALEIENDRIM